MRTATTALALLLAAGGAAAETCYTVVDRSNRTIYQSQDTPIDLSYQIGDRIYPRFPSATVMVIWDAKGDCVEQRDRERIAAVIRTARADRE
jgi:hypothetical protein